MIDFRYHIVSLISVFLALAVGIALGAGPLKEAIGDTLTGQVEQLRTEKDSLRTELDAATAELDETNAYVGAAAPQLLAGALTDRRIAVIALGEVSQDEADALDAQLVAAGASVSAHVTIAEAWTDPDRRTYRQALVGNLSDYLDPVPEADAGLETELAEALVQALTNADPSAPDALTEPASILLELLSSGDDPLVSVRDAVTAPADAVVVLVPAATESDSTATPAANDTDVLTAELAVLVAAQARAEGAVLADLGRVEGGLTDLVIADAELAGTLTTVSGVDRLSGQVSVPLALGARIAGTTGHFGFGEDETPVPERASLAPVDRTPQPSTDVAGTGDTTGAEG